MAVNPHLKIYELITDAVGHHLSVPEFQRGFVWKPTQVRDLAESLWLNYPIGSLLIWNSQRGVEERVARDARRPSLWIVDGQQRTSALCILFGRKPYWWSSAEDWDKKLKRYDIRLDVEATEPPFFWVANAAIRKTRGDRWIKLSKLLNLDIQKKEDQQALQDLAREIKAQGLCNGMDAMEVYARLDQVRKIREKDLVSITVDHELEDVVEIFARLNSRGTRVTEADIYLGVVAAKAPGWVRDDFLPFLNVLKDYGFDLGPNLLFRSLTAIAAGKTRFRDIADEIWDAESIKPAWDKCKEAWKNLVKRLAEYGVLSNDPLPTEAALVALVALQNKFPNSPSFDSAFYWFLEASRFGRYSGSGTTAMDEDLRDINEAGSSGAAISSLLRRFDRTKAMEPDEFMRDYSDARFSRFLLYLILYKNQARDWDERGHRLGFEGPEALADFRPQWHHIFPVKFLEKKVDDDKINALANIAVIGSAINIKISKKDPMDYLDRYKISDKKLEQQFVPIERNEFRVERFDEFLEKRAERLAREANGYLGTLGQEVASVDSGPSPIAAMSPSMAISEPEKGDMKVFTKEIYQTPPLVGTSAFDVPKAVARPEGRTEIIKTDNNTIVVPAQKEGFERVFLGENCWHAIRISTGMLEKIRFIAAYQTAPVSAITHTAPVERIELYGKDGKYKLIFSEPAKKLEHPIPYSDTPQGYMQGPKYTSFAKLKEAKRVADLFD